MNVCDPWPPAPVLRGLKMAVLEHPLVFKVPAQTSRDTLETNPPGFWWPRTTKAVWALGNAA